MPTDDAAVAVAYDFEKRAREQFIERLTVYNEVKLSPSAVQVWEATYERTLGQYLGQMKSQHPTKDVWGSKKLKMLPEFIMNRIDLLAEAFAGVTGEVEGDALAREARAVIASPATQRNCAEMLRLYDAALRETVEDKPTPICPAEVATVQPG